MTTATTPASTSSTPRVNSPVTRNPDVLPPISKKDDSSESDDDFNEDNYHHEEDYDDLYEDLMNDNDSWKDRLDQKDDHVANNHWNFWLKALRLVIDQATKRPRTFRSFRSSSM
ncbi:hypothetical protein DPMN_005009 [Dreissena polymorpha]|uniref:Uncharacterized protein n=1 Tax=Dreissena polymorpha TaxID=45954 RepID=A0A9D4RW37_DREPO|nr:hypothetical protein DPMN_005009 [Dreissena polymorpha]